MKDGECTFPNFSSEKDIWKSLSERERCGLVLVFDDILDFAKREKCASMQRNALYSDFRQATCLEYAWFSPINQRHKLMLIFSNVIAEQLMPTLENKSLNTRMFIRKENFDYSDTSNSDNHLQ